MVKYLTLDSSVLVAALRTKEKKHKICKELIRLIVEGKCEAIEPYIALVEVVAAVKRRSGSIEFAARVRKGLIGIRTITFTELIKQRVLDCCNIVEITGMRGMDALVVQAAKENNTSLVTLDDEMAEKTAEIVKIEKVEDLVFQEKK